MSFKYNGMHSLMFLISAMILGFGTACFVKANLGADALSTFALGIHIHTGISVDIAIFLIMYMMMLITYWFDKTKLGLLSFLYPFISSLSMRTGLQILLESEDIVTRYMMLFTGMILMALAIAIGSQTKVGYNSYDSLAFALLEHFHLTYTKVRWMIDGCFLITGVLMGATFASGTILVLILLGPCADFFMSITKKPLQMILKTKEETTI